ncbi:MAG: hypothetical protein NVS3B14_00920 [Ktedonobacteraceae bacterium]
MFVTLNYHIINCAIRDGIAVSEDAFEQQLDYLREYGYTTILLVQVAVPLPQALIIVVCI